MAVHDKIAAALLDCILKQHPGAAVHERVRVDARSGLIHSGSAMMAESQRMSLTPLWNSTRTERSSWS